MSQLHCTPLSSLSVTDTPCVLVPQPRYLRLISADVPFEDRRYNDSALEVAREVTFALIDALRGTAYASSPSAGAAADASASSSSAGAAADAPAAPRAVSPLRRSSRSSQPDSAAPEATSVSSRSQHKAADDDRIPLQIINEYNAGPSRWADNSLRPSTTMLILARPTRSL